MTFRRRGWFLAIVGAAGLALATAAPAQVVVVVDGDTAYATVSVTDTGGTTYDADVTIVFDTPQNLTPAALNLTARVIDPNDINPRLARDQYNASNCDLLFGCPTVDPAFPVMITVEPVVIPWLFASGFDGGDSGNGVFSFINTYQLDVHTHDLAYVDGSPYRLFKAPVDGNFHDVTTDVMAGSMRARGRGGAFSEFVIASDPRLPLTASLQKIVELNVRILASILSDGLQLDLVNLLVQVNVLLLIDITGALAVLDSLIDLIDLNAGSEIANVWSADHSLVNDAGEMDELARTLKFSMLRQQGAVAHP